MSGSEYESNKDSGNEGKSHHSSDNDTVVWSSGSEKIVDNSPEKNRLMDEKYKLILRFNAGAIDRDECLIKIMKINKIFNSLENVNDYENNQILEKELYFNSLLETYTREIDKNGDTDFLNQTQLLLLESLYDEINTLRSKFNKDELEQEEEEKLATLEETLEAAMKKERTILRRVAKQAFKRGLTKTLLEEPERAAFKNTRKGERKYREKYNQYVRAVSKFMDPTQIYSNNYFNYIEVMKPTKLGTEFLIPPKTLKQKVLEEKQLREELPIRVGPMEAQYFRNRDNLKKIMMKMEQSKLIDCASSIAKYNFYDVINPDSMPPIDRTEFISRLKRVRLKPSRVQTGYFKARSKLKPMAGNPENAKNFNEKKEKRKSSDSEPDLPDISTGTKPRPPSKIEVQEPSILNEGVQAYKRYIMIESLQFGKEYSTFKNVTKQQSEKSEGTFFKRFIIDDTLKSGKVKQVVVEKHKILRENKFRILHILEMLDINDLLYKNAIIQRNLIYELNTLLPPGYNWHNFKTFQEFNNYYYKFSNDKINTSNRLKDMYGNFIYKMINTIKDPIDFYPKQIHKKYYSMVNQYVKKPEPIELNRKLRIMYNPHTGHFGDPNGWVFDVDKLLDNGRGQPFMNDEPFTEINPRTNAIEYGNHKVPVIGKDNFIKVPMLTNKTGVFKNQWVRVPPGRVGRMLTNDHDTCNRFRKKLDCRHGRGIGSAPCYYDKANKICKADYSIRIRNQYPSKFNKVKELEEYSKTAGFTLFGKKGKKRKVKIQLRKDRTGIKYTLKMSASQRHKALVKRINKIKKSGKTLRQSAVAVKRRLVVLRTFRKNKGLSSEISKLNNDIKYIDKRFFQ